MSKAKTMDQETMWRFMDWVRTDVKDAEAMLPVYMLSFMVGLRVQEVAGLRWDTHIFQSPGVFHSRQFPKYDDGKPCFDSDYRVIQESVNVIEIAADISKYTGERTLPLPVELEKPLMDLWKADRSEFVVPPGPGDHGASKTLKQRAHALCVRANRWYRKCPFTTDGFTTHSGRRSFGTRSARMANATGCSLRDTQALLGHTSIRTTQDYVDIAPNHGTHVRSLWA